MPFHRLLLGRKSEERLQFSKAWRVPEVVHGRLGVWVPLRKSGKGFRNEISRVGIAGVEFARLVQKSTISFLPINRLDRGQDHLEAAEAQRFSHTDMMGTALR